MYKTLPKIFFCWRLLAASLKLTIHMKKEAHFLSKLLVIFFVYVFIFAFYRHSEHQYAFLASVY